MKLLSLFFSVALSIALVIDFAQAEEGYLYACVEKHDKSARLVNDITECDYGEVVEVWELDGMANPATDRCNLCYEVIGGNTVTCSVYRNGVELDTELLVDNGYLKIDCTEAEPFAQGSISMIIIRPDDSNESVSAYCGCADESCTIFPISKVTISCQIQW